MADTIHVRGEGGTIFEMDLPLPEGVAQRLAFGSITRVNADGSTYEPSESSDPARVPRPSKAASTEAWIAYAIDQGADPDEAKDCTRAELIELYGQD